MEWWMLLIVIFGVLLALIFFGVPIAFSLGFVSLGLVLILWGVEGFYLFAATAYGQLDNFSLVAIPLFILMAEFILHSGVSRDAFDMLSKWTGWLPGGLAVSSQISCTLFAAVCGASTATTATIGTIAVPEMLKRNYDKRLATGVIAAGGTLGALIPPSIYMIIYGTLVEQSIGKLFMGGIIPGLLSSAMYIIFIIVRCKLNPKLAPALTGVSWAEKWRSFWKVWAIVFLAMSMLIAIYLGIATPSEIAGVGCFFAFIIGLAYRNLNWQNIKNAFLSTCRITCFIGWILVAAAIFGYILSYLLLPQQLCDWLTSQNISPFGVIIGINLIIILLGCIMDPAGILLVTVPIFFPIIVSLGFDPIWFGVMFVINTELGQITPPLGLNLYIMKGIAPSSITLKDILFGAAPFLIFDVICLFLVIVFPEIILWLPSKMM